MHHRLADVHEQVLAAGPDALAGHAGEINGGVVRHADGGGCDLATLHPLQALGKLVDGITFGHSDVYVPLSAQYLQHC